MSALLLSRIDTGKLYPPFLKKVQAMLDEALAAGISYWVISGFRSYAEQDGLYAQGRTTAGGIVTNARGGQSAHQFGIAVDLCRDGLIDRVGLQPNWKPESYEALRALAPKHGLVWGGSWKFVDLPHVQLPGYVTGLDLKPLKNVFELGHAGLPIGLASVFRFLDNAEKAICL